MSHLYSCDIGGHQRISGTGSWLLTMRIFASAIENQPPRSTSGISFSRVNWGNFEVRVQTFYT
jgi:hypothetical protein